MVADNLLIGVFPCASASCPRREDMRAGFWGGLEVFLGLQAVADWAGNATCGLLVTSVWLCQLGLRLGQLLGL
ncbi:uncharacterized protein PpBr36_05731 [Pyricularia pennisetigena]|uniref:uncharacterized protein n=1 Tax=Pyricularia pennisetigena TaxID=1578925 RepID=UPI001153056E|nr:uncharacterized protein PpBr36_05731 [Pyricularia pennisetigena]TLS22617.1 hypothetical protein PpBr36_05731 [Pyricularia pennisetigena]